MLAYRSQLAALVWWCVGSRDRVHLRWNSKFPSTCLLRSSHGILTWAPNDTSPILGHPSPLLHVPLFWSSTLTSSAIRSISCYCQCLLTFTPRFSEWLNDGLPIGLLVAFNLYKVTNINRLILRSYKLRESSLFSSAERGKFICEKFIIFHPRFKVQV